MQLNLLTIPKPSWDGDLHASRPLLRSVIEILDQEGFVAEFLKQ